MRRLVLATLVVGVIAAANAGPAMADGLPKLSDVLADPVGTVTETATTTVEDVTVVVDSTVQEVEGTVAEVVEGTGVTLETVAENGAPAPQAAPAAPAETLSAENPVSTPSQAALPAPADGGGASEPSVAEPGTPGRLAVASADVRDAGPAARDVPSVTAPLKAGPESARTGTPSTRTALSPDPIRSATTSAPRNRVQDEPRPDQRSQADPPPPGGLAIELPSPVPLAVALLGLLALTAPRPRGPRLRPAVATAHPADVRFRLVRPG
jgi:hypothetical protein